MKAGEYLVHISGKALWLWKFAGLAKVWRSHAPDNPRRKFCRRNPPMIFFHAEMRAVYADRKSEACSEPSEQGLGRPSLSLLYYDWLKRLLCKSTVEKAIGN